ncbi:calcium-binding protein [Dolichospermum compactum]|uniref:Type I secretion target repeat protein n=1 Tax=Dolichospermum compactum NIES-806 TaxID=1973481 RepID=A0A1Z4VBE3_9CYAN|nr:calcium-binding protein [Dolichospermum compactum]BAZ88525.1 type I secretion target repeat protein [Dolichospermum compactum NIES-806]
MKKSNHKDKGNEPIPSRKIRAEKPIDRSSHGLVTNDLLLASVFSPSERINGFEQNDLGDIWWQTFFGIPNGQNPGQFDDSSDPNGAAGSSDKASLTRIDSIQFLAGKFTTDQQPPGQLPITATAERTIKVAGGSVFFFPTLNAVSPDVPLGEDGEPIRNSDGTLVGGIGTGGPTEGEVKIELDTLLAGIKNLSASIDGVEIPNLLNYRQKSDQPFSYTLPEDNISDIPGGGTFGGVLADGYWVGIGNLSPEDHVIKFGGSVEFNADNPGPDFVVDITYNISFDLNEIKGTNRKDTLFGTNGWDEIKGLNGNDYIVGREGNDALYGGNGRDTLIGVNPYACNPGLGEIDIFYGGKGRDTFVLGNSRQAYYQGKGLQDYALIKDFNTQDIIQLHGNRCSYELSETYSLGGKSGTSIFLKDTSELIGFVEGVTSLCLASNDFSFVCY